MREILRFDREYNIPVYFQIENISMKYIVGDIKIKNGEIPFLEANIYDNDIDIPNEETKSSLIYCHQKEGGKVLLLIDSTISTVISISGNRRTFHIYFDYIINGKGNIQSEKDLKFKSVILSFENLYKWTAYKHYNNEKDQEYFSTTISNIFNKKAKIIFFKAIKSSKTNQNDERLREEEKDTKIELRLINTKFTLEEVKKVIKNLEILLTCISGNSCFCIDATLKNRRASTVYHYFYNLYISDKLSEPKFKLKSFRSTFNPIFLNYPDELEIVFNNYFENYNSMNSLMAKLSSTILYDNRFLYDVKFHYLATLIETANRLFINDEKKEVNLSSIKKCLNITINDSDIVKDIISSIPFLLKGTFRKKIRNLEKYQYDECKIIKLNNNEINFIKNNRDLLSHGESWELNNDIDLNIIFDKMNILLLYGVWKKLGFSAEFIKENILRSFASFQFPIEDEVLKYEKYEKIFISHKEFNKVLKQNPYTFIVLEKYNGNIIFNEKYTKYLSYDHHYISYYKDVGSYLKCYYNKKAIKFKGYKQNLYIVNKSNFNQRKLFYQYFFVEITSKERNTAYSASDSLIPQEVYKIIKKNESILKKYREYRKISIQELAKMAKLSNSTISKYENNYKIPNYETYRNILFCLGTELLSKDEI